jgi:hypothetical protein
MASSISSTTRSRRCRAPAVIRCRRRCCGVRRCPMTSNSISWAAARVAGEGRRPGRGRAEGAPSCRDARSGPRSPPVPAGAPGRSCGRGGCGPAPPGRARRRCSGSSWLGQRAEVGVFRSGATHRAPPMPRRVGSSIPRMVNLRMPPGVRTTTTSPCRRPRRAIPTGEATEMVPRRMSASPRGTIVYSSSPQVSRTRTLEPRWTSMPFTADRSKG